MMRPGRTGRQDPVARPRLRVRRWPLRAISLLLAAAWALPLWAFEDSNPRSTAMAEAYTALARGTDALAWNPANLALQGNPKFSVNLFSASIDLSNNAIDRGDYNRYSGAFLGEVEKQELLGSIPESGLRFSGTGHLSLFDISYRNYAVSLVRGIGCASAVLPRDLLDLALNGNEFGRQYDFGEADGEGWVVQSISIGAAQTIPLEAVETLAVGATVKYLRGYGYGRVIESGGSLVTDDQGLYGDGRFVVRTAVGGSGLALDLGAAAVIDPRWTVGLKLGNVLGRIWWDTDTEERRNSFLADWITVVSVSEGDSITSGGESAEIASFTSDYPFYWRLGGCYRWSPTLVQTFDYEQGFRKAPGLSTTPRLATGVEYAGLWWMPLRAGLSLGGREGFLTAFGLEVSSGIVDFDVAMANKHHILPFCGKGLRAAVGCRVNFY